MLDVRFARALRRYRERPGPEMWRELARLYRQACEFNEITPDIVRQYVDAKTAEERRRAAEARAADRERQARAQT